jgi:hypothetical protein
MKTILFSSFLWFLEVNCSTAVLVHGNREMSLRFVIDRMLAELSRADL